jgi:HemY protein
MWRILVFLGIASALALGAVWLAEQPGDVSIAWRGLTIETTAAVAAVGVALLVVLGMLLWSVLRFLFGLPTAFSFASSARKRARGFEAVSRGMVAVGAGDPQAARRHAADARKLIGAEPLTLLLTAQAAQISGDKPMAEDAFKAMLSQPETKVLGLRGLFVEARRRGDQIAARAFADEAVRLSPSLAWANDALLEFHSAAGEWGAARTAVERRAALRLADKTESRRHRAVLLAAEALDAEAGDPATALDRALAAVKLEPGLTPAAALAGRLLGRRGDIRKAARILEAAWRVQPHPDLARAYVAIRQGDSAADRLQKAEALMKLKPTDPESAFIVAECAIAARDFARARTALAPLLASVATVRACLLMAEIEDGEHGQAGRAREWLQRSVRALRDNAWVADGLVSERWMPASPATGRLDAFVWTLPPAALGAAALIGEGFDAPKTDVSLAETDASLPAPMASVSSLPEPKPPEPKLPESNLPEPAPARASAPEAPGARMPAGDEPRSPAPSEAIILSAPPAEPAPTSVTHAAVVEPEPAPNPTPGALPNWVVNLAPKAQPDAAGDNPAVAATASPAGSPIDPRLAEPMRAPDDPGPEPRGAEPRTTRWTFFGR